MFAGLLIVAELDLGFMTRRTDLIKGPRLRNTSGKMVTWIYIYILNNIDKKTLQQLFIYIIYIYTHTHTYIYIYIHSAA